MHLYSGPLVLLPFIVSGATSAGLYTKSSPVLQVDATSYESLIARSNYTSILEFYAPWCGHCQNLKPAYEKAAQSLSGYAKVAAINCDEELNKGFCGGMGVQGFPTLKIIKPGKRAEGKKAPKPVIEDYQGPRTAKAIDDAVMERIPNHVTRLKADNMLQWLGDKPSTPKALFFGSKANISPLWKALAIDFLDAIDFAYVRDPDNNVGKKFGMESSPGVMLQLSGSDPEPIKYNGELKKAPLVDFFSQITPPHPDTALAAPRKEKGRDKKATKKDQTKNTNDNTKAMPEAASETLETDNNPLESPDPDVSKEKPAPIQVPIQSVSTLPLLRTGQALQGACMHRKATTCILAFVPKDGGAGAATDSKMSSGDEISEAGISANPVIQSLSDIAHKHAQRGAKIPFYAVPVPIVDAHAPSLDLGLDLTNLGKKPAIVAVNVKRAWFSRYEADDMSRDALETWIDSVKFGEGAKTKLRVDPSEEGVKVETHTVSANAVNDGPVQIEIEELSPDEMPNVVVKEEETVVVVEDRHDEL